MIQDIAPHKYHLEYAPYKAKEEDIVLIYQRNNVLVKNEEALRLPTRKEAEEVLGLREDTEYYFLFSIDETRFFTVPESMEKEPAEGWMFMPPMMLRTARPLYLSYAAATASHLFNWYRNNKFCGRCGQPMIRSEKERMLMCPACHNMVYPRISPSVIIGVVDREKNRLLVTQYNPNHVSDPNDPTARRREARRPGVHYALVAGYIEIGESGEMCVEREVFEEVGLKVKNIRYWGSQPWAFSSSFLVGYVCDLSGSDQIRLQEDELSQAVFVRPEELPDRSFDISLTSAIMEAFRTGQI